MVGLGKMGLSHLAILRAHPELDVVAGCDSTAYLTDVLTKYTGLKCYDAFDRMLAQEKLDALVIATPSKLHAPMVQKALDKGLHVFCEKPFVLDVRDGERLVTLAEKKRVVTQVGYHYRFVGAFMEAARIVKSGALGAVHHVRAEAYGPVVLREKGGTWRSAKNEGGGALYDYACHAIDLVNFIAGVPSSVGGVVRHGVFSKGVDDEIYCTLHYPHGASGQLCVNWSDESFRKMSTKVSVWGTNGRVTAEAVAEEEQELSEAIHPEKAACATPAPAPSRSASCWGQASPWNVASRCSAPASPSRPRSPARSCWPRSRACPTPSPPSTSPAGAAPPRR
jgi:predicted dehydrogenase